MYAESEEEARELAEKHFRSDERTYKNEAGSTVTVTPTTVVDVATALIDDLSVGGDLCIHVTSATSRPTRGGSRYSTTESPATRKLPGRQVRGAS
ncbi:DUF4288 domain-containing protein [Nocardia carnea]|uniref:DUF4288 domain-containing protein n=1 Tax=Nocardia carnea TaxID=37328 RepID=UPI003D77DEE1